ncbi:DNA polymerase III subunit gamma and tau [Rothia nasisuis]|uniref:DNA polymerase III subunit gamma and tau n=2 Tax=Rothia nasisuis TaxID=2109647 RepID=UPI001F0180D2|nr:DNA polymerase III subunit gamma and tau [Rothia nasisuis]
MSTALYRRYRPESFTDVIGQEHVTEPLMTALAKNRVNHAYLFSGPRGCGKTTSARILARCLNCAEGPTPHPCGVCESCTELSRDGGGSLDVIEMDAASHGGVDHARDLRERATFAPVRDRYKIFIIDEAHMVTREGFNALLKIVEEPPAHIKFIFATTEPNKVLGTIRSRTHHYPFRLVPPQILGNYLAKLCAEEGVKVADGVLPLVVRAGGGSVRDSLSILDQLMAGATNEQGISYDLAVALLGFTHSELLDEVVDAFASGSAAQVFSSVDRVIQTGQDPRRFVEDLLERFRDVIMVKAVPDAAGSILRGLPTDQLERLRTQAELLGSAELTRAADVTNEALNEMSGAMNPQLHLELLCARLLLTTGEQSVGALTARLDRLERQLASGQGGAVPVQNAQPPSRGGADGTQGSGSPLERARRQLTQPPARQDSGASQTSSAGQASSADRPPLAAPLAGAPLADAPSGPSATQADAQGTGPQSTDRAQPVAHQPGEPGNPGQNTVDMVLNSWSDVVARVQAPFARAQFALCEPSKFENGALFLRAEMAVLKSVKDYLPQLQQALNQVLSLQVQLRGEVKKPGGSSDGNGGARPPQGAAQGSAGGRASSQQNQQPPHTNQGWSQAQEQPPAPQQGSARPGPTQQTPAPLAEGPRGGEQAWAAHGQPRSPEPPAWSQDDWNNPVTTWQVASIPREEGEGAPEGGQAQPESAAAGAANTDTPTRPAPPGPHLRVIEGEADPVEIAKAQHPSSGSQEQQNISLASEHPEQGGSAGQHEQSPHAVSLEPVPTTQGLAEQGHKGADNAAINSEHQGGEASGQASEETAENSATGGTTGPASEYANGEGGYFDETPETAPEHRAEPGSASPEQEAPAALQRPSTPADPAPEKSKPGGKLSFRERHAAQIAAGQQAVQRGQAPALEAPEAPEDFTPSDDDAALESSVLIGQKAVEKILGGKVIDERPLHQG